MFNNNGQKRRYVKEGLDKLPVGLCYGYKSGQPILVNELMSKISNRFFGHDLVNSKDFWYDLSSEKFQPGYRIIYLEEVRENVNVLCPDETCYSFSKKHLNISGADVYEIMAEDISQLYKLILDLQRSNVELLEREKRVREYALEVIEVTKKEELLNKKIQIHGDIGKMLQQTKAYISSGESGLFARQYLKQWSDIIDSLRSSQHVNQSNEAIDLLKKTANDLKVELTINGLPMFSKSDEQLFFFIASEGLVNAIKHGKASKVVINIINNKNFTRYEIIDNGEVAKAPIKEGGGLSSIRLKVQQRGGTVEIKTEPLFRMIVTLPVISKGGNDNGR